MVRAYHSSALKYISSYIVDVKIVKNCAVSYMGRTHFLYHLVFCTRLQEAINDVTNEFNCQHMYIDASFIITFEGHLSEYPWYWKEIIFFVIPIWNQWEFYFRALVKSTESSHGIHNKFWNVFNWNFESMFPSLTWWVGDLISVRLFFFKGILPEIAVNLNFIVCPFRIIRPSIQPGKETKSCIGIYFRCEWTFVLWWLRLDHLNNDCEIILPIVASDMGIVAAGFSRSLEIHCLERSCLIHLPNRNYHII